MKRKPETLGENQRKMRERFQRNHTEGKILHCDGCGKDIFISSGQVGGFWHLRDWENSHGQKFSGGYCPGCFRNLGNIISKPNAQEHPAAERK